MMFFKFRTTGVPIPRYTSAHLCNRAKVAYSSRAPPVQVRRSSATAIPKRRSFRRHSGLVSTRGNALDTLRSKPRLFAVPQNASFWSLRGYPFWHRRGCTWVNSEGDPRRAQRDKDCPACQEHVKMPVQLSERELMWQRQMQFMRNWIDKDPYDALFGWSNDIRKGLPRRNFWEKKLLRRFGWDELSRSDHLDTLMSSNEPNWRRGIFRNKNEKDASEAEPASTESSSKPVEVNETVSKSNPEVPSQPEGYSIRGWGHWEVSSTDGSGQVTKRSGDMIYDPITMRMIPLKEPPKVADAKETSSTTPTGPNQAENITVKKFDHAPNNEPTGKEFAEALPAQDAIKTTSATPQAESFSDKPGPTESTPLGIAVSEQRLALIRRAERAMTLAQNQLDALSLTLNRDQSRSVQATELHQTIRSLQKTHSAFRGLKQDGRIGHTNRSLSAATDSAQNLVGTTDKSSLKEPSPIKEALENSWAKENASRQQFELPKTTLDSSYAAPNPNKNPSTTANLDSAHDMATLAQRRHNPILRRERALKHMTAFELGTHRAALLKSWAKKQRQSREATPAQRKLDEEIRIQKEAMAAYETRAKQNAPASLPTTKSVVESFKGASTPVNAASAEGDISPNAAKFASTERWYKKKAPHALTKEHEKMHDRALVAEIKDIYEQAYGLINDTHRQGTISQEQKPSKLQEDEPSTALNESASRVEQDITEDAGKAPASSSPTPRQPSKPVLYQVLAWDRKTKSVHAASASASYSPPTGDKVLSFTDALERLHHPAEFLPYISKLHAKGYEMVSANQNLLVFKKISTGKIVDQLIINELSSVTNESKKAEAEARVNTLIGEYASAKSMPDTSRPPKTFGRTKPSSVPSASNPRVRKEEAVFTGRSLKEPSGPERPPGREFTSRGKRSRSTSSTRLFIITGKLAIAAACVYLIGCLIEELYDPASDTQFTTETPSEAALSGSERPESTVVDEKEGADRTFEHTHAGRSGFWAAVNKEQARRAENRRLEAVRKIEEERRKLGSSDAISGVTAMAVDVALFSSALWVVLKLLNLGS